ncbi:MAG: hypothetical protein BWY73_01298 [candidate division TA06 bacterium ADurb.Bin417]|uniref:Uncharacterized protein n=1 Tax=candidate division TA06 bacterium ADurb.Bin417 TaxID=1852828 RepID=A0A1V5MC79_UNCT6|nr:MAG: hypothetical protein BWY73_01298 [candidate division TA06 bacterium ADurb.Bin417]
MAQDRVPPEIEPGPVIGPVELRPEGIVGPLRQVVAGLGLEEAAALPADAGVRVEAHGDVVGHDAVGVGVLQEILQVIKVGLPVFGMVRAEAVGLVTLPVLRAARLQVHLVPVVEPLAPILDHRVQGQRLGHGVIGQVTVEPLEGLRRPLRNPGDEAGAVVLDVLDALPVAGLDRDPGHLPDAREVLDPVPAEMGAEGDHGVDALPAQALRPPVGLGRGNQVQVGRRNAPGDQAHAVGPVRIGRLHLDFSLVGFLSSRTAVASGPTLSRPPLSSTPGP